MNAIALIRGFSNAAIFALVGILAVLVVIGLANAVFVIVRTMSSAEARVDPDAKPVALIGMRAYLHMLADILLVVVGIELIDTFVSFLDRESPKVYLSGVVGAAIVALARRVIVFFDPDAAAPIVAEMFAYAALVAALAIAFGVIRAWG